MSTTSEMAWKSIPFSPSDVYVTRTKQGAQSKNNYAINWLLRACVCEESPMTAKKNLKFYIQIPYSMIDLAKDEWANNSDTLKKLLITKFMPQEKRSFSPSSSKFVQHCGNIEELSTAIFDKKPAAKRAAAALTTTTTPDTTSRGGGGGRGGGRGSSARGSARRVRREDLFMSNNNNNDQVDMEDFDQVKKVLNGEGSSNLELPSMWEQDGAAADGLIMTPELPPASAAAANEEDDFVPVPVPPPAPKRNNNKIENNNNNKRSSPLMLEQMDKNKAKRTKMDLVEKQSKPVNNNNNIAELCIPLHVEKQEGVLNKAVTALHVDMAHKPQNKSVRYIIEYF